MKNITKKQKIIFIILAVIIIAGIAVISTIGFNLELKMQETKKIELYIQKDFEISDIKNIVKEVIPDESIMIQKVEVFEDSVSITAKDITEEQKQSIIDKVNEKYGTELKADSTEIINIPNMKIRDLVKPYVTSFAISTVLILVYIAIRYRKLGFVKTMLKSLLDLVNISFSYLFLKICIFLLYFLNLIRLVSVVSIDSIILFSSNTFFIVSSL